MSPADYDTLRLALDQFNSSEFIACHETLEALWLADPTPQRRFYQGVIQVAAAYVHWQRGRIAGIVPLLEAGLSKLTALPDRVLGVDVARLRRDTQAAVAFFGREGAAGITAFRPARLHFHRLTAADLSGL